MRDRVFTLLELLVVVAIISMLAALLLPALNESRKTATRIKCVSQLKQMGAGLAMYENDFDAYIPGWCMSAADSDETLRWVTRLVPYVGDVPTLWICPAAAEENRDHFAIDQINKFRAALDANFTASFRKVQTIGINAVQYTPNGDSFRSAFRYTTHRAGSIQNPASVWYAGDATGQGAWYAPNNPNGQQPILGPKVYPLDGSSLYPHHRNIINVMLLDGHCESVPRTDMANRANSYLLKDSARFWVVF